MSMSASPRWSLLGHWLLIAAVFAGLAVATWNTWPDIVVDYGHQLYIPWRLTEGEVLYRDIVYPMGPASQSFLALWFLVLGSSLQTAVIANLVVLAALVVLLHGLFRQLAGDHTATALVLFFLVVFGFSNFAAIGNYNFVTPYRHEVTHGLVLCVLQIWSLGRWLATQRTRWLGLSSLALGLTLLVKVEFALPALAVGIWTAVACHRRLSRRDVLALALPAVGVVLLAWAWLATQMPPTQAVESLWLNWRLAFDPELTADSGFYRALAGLNDPVESLVRMAMSLVYNLLLVLLAWTIDRAMRGLVPNFSTRTAITLAVGTAGVLLIPAGLWHLLPQSFVVFDLVVLGVCAWYVHKQCAGDGTVLLGAFALLAVLTVPKMLLTLSWGHYGFVLAVPSALLVLHLGLHEAPERLKARGGGPFFRATVLGIALGCAVSLAMQSFSLQSGKTLAFGAGHDQFLVDPRNDARAVPLHRLLRHLKATMGSGETLLVIPDGAMLNFQLRRRKPDRPRAAQSVGSGGVRRRHAVRSRAKSSTGRDRAVLDRHVDPRPRQLRQPVLRVEAEAVDRTTIPL